MKHIRPLKKAAFILCIMLISLMLGGCWSSEKKDSSAASMFRANLERTGVFPSGGPSTLNELIWKFKTENVVDSSPAISGGIVYFGSDEGHLYAVDIKTGQEKWRFKTEDEVSSSPAISGGIVYFGSRDHHLYAVK